MSRPHAHPLLLTAAAIAVVLACSGCSREPRLTTSSPDALRLYQEGLTQWEKFYYTEAKASFEQAISSDSAFAMAWARLAMVNMANLNEADAREEMQRALRLMGPATRREQLFIRMLDRRINYDDGAAAAIADSIVHLFPDAKEAYIVRGNVYEVNNKYEAALESYKKAAEVDTGYARAYMHIGYMYSNLGEQDKALRNMEHYIRLAPDAADPHASYADLLMRVGRYEEALKEHQKALTLKPDYWYSFLRIGNIYGLMGRLKEAEVQYHRSLQLRPSNRSIEAGHLVVAAYLNSARGKFREAIEMDQSALALDSTNAEAAYGLVYALGELRQFKDAWNVASRIRQELARRNMLTTTSMLGYHLMRANLLMREGRLEEAIVACDSAKEFSDQLTRAPVFRMIAEIHLRQGITEDALDAAEEALRVNPNSPDVLLTLVRIYRATGDRDLMRDIGGRLLDFWSKADPDFRFLKELKLLLTEHRTSPSVVT
jgi:tetratricopeptide (TPR) repeat protein